VAARLPVRCPRIIIWARISSGSFWSEKGRKSDIEESNDRRETQKGSRSKIYAKERRRAFFRSKNPSDPRGTGKGRSSKLYLEKFQYFSRIQWGV